MEKRASVYFILKKKKNKKEKAGPHPSERLVTRTAGKLQRADSHHGGKALGRARCEPGTHTLQAPPHAPLAGRCSSTRTTGRAWPLGPPLGGSPSVGKCLILAHPHILCRPPPTPALLPADSECSGESGRSLRAHSLPPGTQSGNYKAVQGSLRSWFVEVEVDRLERWAPVR